MTAKRSCTTLVAHNHLVNKTVHSHTRILCNIKSNVPLMLHVPKLLPNAILVHMIQHVRAEFHLSSRALPRSRRTNLPRHLLRTFFPQLLQRLIPLVFHDSSFLEIRDLRETPLVSLYSQTTRRHAPIDIQHMISMYSIPIHSNLRKRKEY